MAAPQQAPAPEPAPAPEAVPEPVAVEFINPNIDEDKREAVIAALGKQNGLFLPGARRFAATAGTLPKAPDTLRLALLHLDADTPLEIVTDGRSLTISPVGDADREANRQRRGRTGVARVAGNR